MLDQIAEHVEEFARHGYQLVLLGNREDSRTRFAEAD